VETLRCPTCLGVLPDGRPKRCPSCRTRLGTRGRPIVLGESPRLSAQPVLPMEWELRKRVGPESAAQAREDLLHAPKLQRETHARRARRLVAAKPRVDELPRFETKIVFVPESVEALVLEPEPEVDPGVVDHEVAKASVVETRIVFVPQNVAAVVAPSDQPEPEARVEAEPILDLTAVEAAEAREIVIPEVVVDDEAARDAVADAGSQLFPAAGRKPRVKKIAKRRRRWVVDYVVPESESGDAEA
jgi:hypothetical protein